MNQHDQQSQRAIGAMFGAVFGTAWLAGWALASFGPAPAVLLPLALAGAALLVLCVRRYRWHRSRAGAPDPGAGASAARRAMLRQFYVVNAVQWLALVVLVNILRNTGHGDWVQVAIIGVVGLHFLPLAWTFHVRAHVVTGLALLLLAALYPHWAPAGPADAVGALGAGLILWASAAWALGADAAGRLVNATRG